MLGYFVKLEKSTDWYKIRDQLLEYCERQTDHGSYHIMTTETGMIINNMEKMVAEISKEELNARRGRGSRVLNEKIAEFNTHLEIMEQLLLIHTMEQM